MARKGRRPAKPWSLHPTLHDDVAHLLEQQGLHFDFFNLDDAESSIKERDTNIMGRFTCPSRHCHSTGWSSMSIAITIRIYSGQKYNARVYHQRCRSCNAIGRPVPDASSYAERVAYWIKKWNGIAVQRPAVSGQSRGPHDSLLCEGCRVGHCTRSDDYLDLQFERWVCDRLGLGLRLTLQIGDIDITDCGGVGHWAAGAESTCFWLWDTSSEKNWRFGFVRPRWYKTYIIMSLKYGLGY